MTSCLDSICQVSLDTQLPAPEGAPTHFQVLCKQPAEVQKTIFFHLGSLKHDNLENAELHSSDEGNRRCRHRRLSVESDWTDRPVRQPFAPHFLFVPVNKAAAEKLAPLPGDVTPSQPIRRGGVSER